MWLEPLEKAIRSLEDILCQPVNPYVRDGVIQQRNLTVHTYNDNVAQEVFEAAKTFPQHARRVLSNLSQEP